MAFRCNETGTPRCKRKSVIKMCISPGRLIAPDGPGPFIGLDAVCNLCLLRYSIRYCLKSTTILASFSRMIASQKVKFPGVVHLINAGSGTYNSRFLRDSKSGNILCLLEKSLLILSNSIRFSDSTTLGHKILVCFKKYNEDNHAG